MLLDHLRFLVSCDTRNPPRAIRGTDTLFSYLKVQLESAGCRVTVRDLGDGAVSLLALRGTPSVLVNIHLDTVPDNPRWTRDPLTLHVEDDRAYGLGACDIKGGAAALVAAAQQTSGDVAILFSTDEEYGHSLCIHDFLAERPEGLEALSFVVVSEPTNCRAVLAHRGFARGKVMTRGEAGHSSEPRGLVDNANHKLGLWLAAAVAHAQELEQVSALGLNGVRFNCGVLEGGRADNVIAAEASALFSVRPPPGISPEELVQALGALCDNSSEVLFTGPPLPARDAEKQASVARERAAELGLELAEPVGFWTEAALFSAAGLPTFVFGPGGISEAHIADEWVLLEELERARQVFMKVLGGRR
ncbi:MAG: acetylornithine deacetylase [Myxococcota bacterium]